MRPPVRDLLAAASGVASQTDVLWRDLEETLQKLAAEAVIPDHSFTH